MNQGNGLYTFYIRGIKKSNFIYRRSDNNKKHAFLDNNIIYSVLYRHLGEWGLCYSSWRTRSS